MKTDIHCKLLARLCPTDLLTLTGDQDAQLLSTDVVELQDIRRTVDFVYKLQVGEEIYYRHIEFQAERDPEMNQRCFLYNTRMIAQYQAPVITTIIYLFRRRRLEEPVFRVMVRGQEVNRWQFDCVRMWEMDAQAALDQGLPGLAVLVPLMKGATLPRIEQAARQIETVGAGEQQADLLALLHAFAEGKYTIEQLERIIGKERLMESTVYQWGLTEGLAKGRSEGRTEGEAAGLIKGQLAVARELCRKAVRKWHPRAGAKVWTTIEACTDLAALEEVNLNASEWSTRDILRRLSKG
jgi:predicted transposase YdaD